MISFCVEIEPVPKGRPRVTKKGHTYTPNKTAAFEKTFAHLAKTHVRTSPLEGPLSCRIVLYFASPKKPAKPYPKGDIDNFAKSILDALNGVLYFDDSQVCLLEVTKEYSDRGRICVSLDKL